MNPLTEAIVGLYAGLILVAVAVLVVALAVAVFDEATQARPVAADAGLDLVAEDAPDVDATAGRHRLGVADGAAVQRLRWHQDTQEIDLAAIQAAVRAAEAVWTCSTT